jgi:hypothetical protein
LKRAPEIAASGEGGSVQKGHWHPDGAVEGKEMTAAELREIVVSSEFKQGLEELSSYLASVKQEKAIVYLLAKCLWKRKHKFALEDNYCDLSVNSTQVEFKFHYDKMAEPLGDELARWPDLGALWAAEKNKSWQAITAAIYKDVCVKQPSLFVWIICSRDVSKVADEDLDRICMGREQRKYNKRHPYNPNGEYLRVADELLEKLCALRPFSVLKEVIATNGDFPSTYHFIICEFSK